MAADTRPLLEGPDPATSSGWGGHPPRMGFFTDTSVCIGCKACEVACKEWNHVPEDGLNLLGMSYDNTGGLGADTWRHVAFIEQPKRIAQQVTGAAPGPGGDGPDVGAGQDGIRWLMASDVCKHCTHAACLDVCPTGALMRTEFGTVVVQEDICNGCGYCVPACPYGVIDQRKEDGRAWKCTLCYDRLSVGAERPAPRRARPTPSSSARWTSCGSGPTRGSGNCRTPGWPTPGCMAATRTTGSAGTARSSSFSTSLRYTGCPRTPW